MKKTGSLGEDFKSFVSAYCCPKCGSSLAMAEPLRKMALTPNIQQVTFTQPAYDYGDLDLPLPEELKPTQKQNSVRNKAFRMDSVTNKSLKKGNPRTREIAGTQIETKQKENLKQTPSAFTVNLVKLLKRNKHTHNRGKNTPKVIKVKLVKK